MTELQVLQWIKANLGPIIRKAIEYTDADQNYFTEELLGAMACRETGFLINRGLSRGYGFVQICANVKGDFGKRKKDSVPVYHGFGFWQIDVGSFPDFIVSGNWKDPYSCCIKAIEVLKGKALALGNNYNPDERDQFTHAMISAYNTGEGNVDKSYHKGLDVDGTTANHNYGDDVLRMREIYKELK